MICLAAASRLTNAAGTGWIPVSYTHLDVYKRQVYYRFAEMPYKLASNESPYDEPKGKEFSVIVLNLSLIHISELLHHRVV